jgi:hypothetical protein
VGETLYKAVAVKERGRREEEKRRGRNYRIVKEGG